MAGLLSLLALLTCLTGEGCDLHHQISLMFRPSACQLSAVVPFWLLVLRSWTAYQLVSPPLHPCQPSGAIWRHTYSAAATTFSDSAHLLYLLWLQWSSWWRCCLGHSKNFCDDDVQPTAEGTPFTFFPKHEHGALYLSGMRRIRKTFAYLLKVDKVRTSQLRV